jgi:hypothetical protein
MADEVMNSTGAILGGRNWYDAATRKYRGRRGIYGGKWNGPVFVLTHRPPESPEDPEITFSPRASRTLSPPPGRPPAAGTS